MPAFKAEVIILDETEIFEIETQGKMRKNSTLDPLGRTAELADYFLSSGFKVIPLHARDIRPGEELSASILLGNFKGSTFPLKVQSMGVSPAVLVISFLETIESTRQLALATPEMFYEDRELVEDRIGFRMAMLQNYIDYGLILAKDTVGVNLNCINCSLFLDEGDYNPDGDVIGTTFLDQATFGSGGEYNWHINKYAGDAGYDRGWDLLKLTGSLNITATPEAPFGIKVSSLDYNDFPSYLGGWYPAVDKCWPIVVASGGITGFDPDKFDLDLGGFLSYNYTYGGTFSIEQTDEYTLSLCFTAYVPKPGEPAAPGIPAGPGGEGGEGGPGGGKGPDGPSGDCHETGDCDPDPDPDPEPDPDPDPNPQPENEDCHIPGTPPGTPCHTDPEDPILPPGGGGGGGSGGGGGGGTPAPPGCSSGGGGGGSLGWWQTSSDYCSPIFTALGCGSAVVGCGVGIVSCATIVGCGLGAAACSMGLLSCFTSLFDVLAGTSTDPLEARAICGTGNIIGLIGEYVDPSKLSLTLIGVDLALCFGEKIVCKPVVGSCDPNEIMGPEGYSDEKFVSKNEALPYTIFFENDPVFATAPAQRVVVRQQLDSNFDPATFRLNGFGFRNLVFDVPSGLTNYTARLNTAGEIGVDVNVTFGLDVTANELFWAIQSIDPATGLPPMDALAGFLPVNDSTSAGEGFVSYSIKAAPETVTGDEIRASANIFFDTNAPIPTNEVVNTIDAFAPTPEELTDVSIQYDSLISFTVFGQDDPGGSGMKDFEVWVSEEGGEYRLLSNNNQIGETFSFQGAPGKNYCLVPVLRDNVNNRTLLIDYEPVCFTTPEVEARVSNFYSLLNEVSGQGTIQVIPNAVAFIEGQEVTVKAIPETGWRFENWEGDLTGSVDELVLVMDGNKSFTATFLIDDSLYINAPENITIETDPGTCEAVVAELGTPVIGGNVTMENVVHDAPDIFALGITIVTWTVTDEYGNISTANQIVTVIDNEEPVITNLPSDFEVTVNSDSCGALVEWDIPFIEDNCEGHSIEQTEGPENGTLFPVGTTAITYTATDAGGNTVEAGFTVTVKDNLKPVISGIPENIVVEREPDFSGAFIEWIEPTATDNCELLDIVSDFQSGDFFESGTTTVTYTATDVNGNVQTTSFTITVSETVDTDIKQLSEIAIWPNPTKGQVYISMHQSVNGEVRVEVYSISGELVYSRQFFADEQISFNLSGKVSGLYTVIVHYSGGTSIEKIVLTNR